ncbi:MAG: beta-lactamase family protein [Oscillospiraceae bacterium]|jgi:CubicO group peptidase (beta-lactamase class C family)|nr:beta-lactamase family protein [Oscillospiraceae bacterium]
MKTTKRILALLLSLVLCFAAPAAAAADRVWPTKEFKKAKAWWLSPAALNAYVWLMAKSIGDQGNSDSLLVLYQGQLVYEHYSKDNSAATRFPVYSVTKSVVSALVGIAVGEGKIKGADQKVIDFFPEAKIAPGQEWKRDMTIEHLLTMTSGIVCDTEEKWELVEGAGVKDSALAAFELPQSNAPGKKWAYDSAAPTILLGIVQRATGRDVLSYAKEKLFGPLGVTSVQWSATPGGLPRGGSGIQMTARDMARFGYLYLNNGRWEDQQIIPASWVAQTPPKSHRPRAYGYLFWRNHLDALGSSYGALGYQGQYIWIAPAQDIVLVRTSLGK